MPIIYLSPSTQEFNYYVNGGTEEYYMNLLADQMVPYLDASGIRYSRNTPDMTAASSIAASNAGNYDLHLSLHSNAAAGDQAGKVRGSIAFYYPGSEEGRRAAQLIVDALKTIYHDPNLEAPILVQAPDGAQLTILNTANGWHLVNYNGYTGYASADYITIL